MTTATPQPASRRYKCVKCGDLFEEAGPALYECNNCGTTFNRDNSANNNHQCPDCNKMSAKVADKSCPDCLGADVEEVVVVTCEYCDAAFEDDADLEKHVADEHEEEIIKELREQDPDDGTDEEEGDDMTTATPSDETAQTNEPKSLEKIADLIKKLQAMAADVSSPAEAALAAERIHSILTKYNLDLQDIEGLSPEERQETYGTEDFVLGRSMDQRRWLLTLLNVVTQHNYCRSVGYGGDRALRATIVGRPHNVEVVKYLFEYLRRELTRLAIAGWAGAKATATSSDYVWKQNFYMGAIAEINKRLEEAEAGAKNGEMALVTTSAGELDEALKERFPTLRPSRKSKRGYDAEAYVAGAKAGKNVAMNSAVGGGKKGGGTSKALLEWKRSGE